MNGLLLTVAMFISTVFLTSSSYADKSKEEGCLRVEILNKTNYTCKRTDFSLKHGQWVDGLEPPAMIRPYTDRVWKACQDTLYGPDMTATFSCNGHSFSVRNQQNFCLLASGNQHYSAYNVDKHLNVTNKQTRHADKSAHEFGVAQIVISLKKSP